MARNIVYVPNAAPSTFLTPVAEIPEDVKKDVEDSYAALKTNPNGRLRIEFANKAEVNLFISQANAYCTQRMVDGKAAPIRFRKSPTRGLADNVMDYTVKDLQTPNEKVTAEVRDATAAANAASGAVPAKATRKGAKAAA